MGSNTTMPTESSVEKSSLPPMNFPGYPQGFLKTLINCPLRRAGSSMDVVAWAYDDEGKVFIHNFQSPDYGKYVVSSRDVLQIDEMVDLCNGCENKPICNPIQAEEHIYLDRSNALMRVTGILINGPQILSE